MDQDASWYEGRPRPRPHCVTWGPSSSLPKGEQPPPPICDPCLLWPRSPISATAEHLFVCVWNISGTAERICAKFTEKTCLVPRSDEFEGQGQRSTVKVTTDIRTKFSADILETAERICDKFTRKTSLVIAWTSLKVRVKGQRSRSRGTEKRHFSVISTTAYVRFMFDKTSLASRYKFSETKELENSVSICERYRLEKSSTFFWLTVANRVGFLGHRACTGDYTKVDNPGSFSRSVKTSFKTKFSALNCEVTYKIYFRIGRFPACGYYIHCVSKNAPPLICYNFDIRKRILTFLAEMLPIK